MPRTSPPTTPLLAILRALENDERRDEFAQLAGTSTAYLYQLATCRTQACRSPLAKGIADASVLMAKKYKTPRITMDVIATMCPAPEGK